MSYTIWLYIITLIVIIRGIFVNGKSCGMYFFPSLIVSVDCAVSQIYGANVQDGQITVQCVLASDVAVIDNLYI